jgi:hypothetical protein
MYGFCPPGRYYGNLTLTDGFNSSENVSLIATVLVPISTLNTLNGSGWNYSGYFAGQMPLNATYYHSFWFNASLLNNATGFTVNISGFNQTIGAFLLYGNGTPVTLYGGPLQPFWAQCDNTSSCELPPVRVDNTTHFSSSLGNMLELRVYGNFSNTSQQTYRGSVFFSTINVTDLTTDQPVTTLDFGVLQPNNASSSMNFSLTNTGGLNLSNVTQSADFYLVRSWEGNTIDQAYNGTQSNLSIIVPNFTTQIEVTVTWRNTTSASVTDWNAYLVDRNGRIVANSTTGVTNSNFTNATMWERIVYSGMVFNDSNIGRWNITVNRSYSTYNLTSYSVYVKMRFNTSAYGSWVMTNFTQNLTLNMSGLANSTRNFRVNITVPKNMLLNGSYEGFIELRNSADAAGWRVRIPVRFSVNVPVLVVNDTIYNTTVRVTENAGLFRKRQFNLTLANLGGSSLLKLDISNSSNLSYESYRVNFTMDTYGQTNTTNTITAGENRSINLTINLSTSGTLNAVGIYTGWITLNVTQNDTNNISVHNVFNISVELNLTKNIIVNVSQYMQGDASKYNPFVNVSNNSNITILINVSLQDTSVLSNSTWGMNSTNFTGITIRERNTSLPVVLASVKDGDSVPCKAGGFCMINATVPSGTPGGRYDLIASAQWNTSSSPQLSGESSALLTGSGIGYPLTVYDAGLYLLSLNSSLDISMGEYTDKYMNISITNYGPKDAGSGAIISVNETCDYVTINATSLYGPVNITPGASTCTFTPKTDGVGNYFTISDIDGNGTSCWVLFKVHSVNVSEGKSCNYNSINISTTAPFFNYIDTPTVSIENTDGGSGGTSSSAGAGSTVPTYYYNRSVAIVTYNTNFNAKLGENISTTVTVKNTGNTTTIVYLTATTNNSAITSLSDPTFVSLGSGSTGSFKIYLNVSNSSKLGLFAGTFKAYVEGYADTWYDTKKFDFNVNATAERVAELSVSYSNYTTQLGNLTAIFNSIKASGLADIGNLTKVDSLFNDTTDLIGKIDAAINSSNYAAAESLIAELAATISRIQTGLADLEASKSAGQTAFFGDLVFWIIIAVIVAGAVGVVIYMLLPPKGGVSRIKGLKIKKPKTDGCGGDSGKTKISNIFKGSEKGELKIPRMKEDVSLSDYAELNGGKVEYTTSKYAEGYERHDMKKGKFKSIFKRKKQERLKDFMKK